MKRRINIGKLAGSALIAVGLLAGGLAIGSGLRSLGERDRVVNVRGLAEREVKANHVVWPLVYKTVGNDIAGINADLAHADAVIKDWLLRGGVADGEISVGAPQVVDLWTNQYNDNRSRERYNATSVITVMTDSVDLVRRLILLTGNLLDSGIAISPNDYEYQVSYTYTDLNSIKPEMIEEATKNAREAAKKFAQDSDSRLGKIKQARQGLFSIDDVSPSTPFMKKVRVVTDIDYYLAN